MSRCCNLHNVLCRTETQPDPCCHNCPELAGIDWVTGARLPLSGMTAAERLIYAIFGVEGPYNSEQFDREIQDSRALANWEGEGGAL
jgi:hypothetical protein